MPTNDVRAIGRATQGVRLIDIEGDDKVVSVARLVEKEDESEPAADKDEEPTADSRTRNHPQTRTVTRRPSASVPSACLALTAGACGPRGRRNQALGGQLLQRLAPPTDTLAAQKVVHRRLFDPAAQASSRRLQRSTGVVRRRTRARRRA